MSSMTASNGSINMQPSSYEEVEQLVKQLYLPRTPQQIAQVNEALLTIQRSQDGWRVGDLLLASQDPNVRFFGALTFTIKLNSDWEALDVKSAEDLLQRLITWFVMLVSQSESSLVVKKICSALVAFFLRFPESWQQCVRHVLCSFHAGRAVSVVDEKQYPPTDSLINKLTPYQATSALWFCSTLVEDVGKADSNSIKNHKLYEKIKINVEDAVSLIGRILTTVGGANGELSDIPLAQEAIKCFHSWVYFSHKAFIDSAIDLEKLKTLTPIALRCIAHNALFEETADLFTDALSNYSRFLRREDIEALSRVFSSQWAEERFNRMRSADFDSESMQFGRLLLAFGDANVQDLAQASEARESQHFMRMLHGLLTCQGIAVAEDEICAIAIEFWSTFVEFMIDSLFAEGESRAPWIKSARGHMVQAIEECWAKIRLPPSEVIASWDSDYRAGFKDFRKDVADLLQSSYPVLGLEIFQKLTQLALQSVENEAWVDTEATLFCLIALSDSVSEGTEEDAVLAQLFGSQMFTHLSTWVSKVPGKTRHTSVNLLGHYASFFERHTEYLPAALNFLFHAIKEPLQAPIASKSIHSLSFSCRSSLTAELGTFLLQYQHFLTTSSADSFTKERVIGAIAAIIQALPDEAAKVHSLEQLLSFVDRDLHSCVNLVRAGDREAATIPGITALQCLVSMGKGMQEPDDIPIDLESDRPRTKFWEHEGGFPLQQRIMQMIETLFNTLDYDGEAVEIACSVLRTGFTETTPGPFVFRPDICTAFLLKSDLPTPRLGIMLATACSLISSHSTESSTRIDNEARALFQHTLSLMRRLGTPANDPEIAQNCIDFFGRLIPRYMNIMLDTSVKGYLEEMFLFTIQCLNGQDVLPKRSAASFWTTFIELHDLAKNEQAAVDEIINHVGPLVAEALVFNFGGHAARSELDILCGPLKRMVFRQVRSKAWLERALFNAAFPSPRVDANEKRIFLQKVINLRGLKTTNQVVKDFWISCRGMSSAYAS